MPSLVSLTAAKRGRSLVTAALTVWFVLALVAGYVGALEGRPAPFVMAAIAIPTALCLLAVWKLFSVRTWVKHLSLRALVGFHAVRFVGIAFLVLHARGALGDFALAAGWGDIFVAITALLLVVFVLPIDDRRDWWIVLGWNVFALADILYVVVTAARLGLADIRLVAPIAAFPMSLLPTFLVPLIITTHVLIFWRLARTRRRLRRLSRSSTLAPISALRS